jgi:hypothetical protein
MEKSPFISFHRDPSLYKNEILSREKRTDLNKSCPPPVFSLMNKKIPEKLSTQRGEFEARRPSRGVDAVRPKNGPYEASEGIYAGRAKKKLGGKLNKCLDKSGKVCFILVQLNQLK